MQPWMGKDLHNIKDKLSWWYKGLYDEFSVLHFLYTSAVGGALQSGVDLKRLATEEISGRPR